MSRVVVINHLTLDGVMQAPGRREEDTRGGFEHGGWAGPSVDEVVNAAMGARMPRSGGLLLGRRSYEDMLGYWNTQDSPFKDILNSAPKYVASRTLREPLPWPNSTLLSGDVAEAVAQLRQQPGKDLNVMGSRELIQTLMRHGLIDEYPAAHLPARAPVGTPAVRRRWPPGFSASHRQHRQHDRGPDRHLPTELGGRTRGPIRDLRPLGQRARRVALGPVGMGYSSDEPAGLRPPSGAGRFGRKQVWR
jgi:dihydrofolate reductase